MSSIDFIGFKGIKSDVSPKLLGDGYAVECTNCFIDSGALTPMRGLTNIIDLGKINTINTLHLINNETWMHYNEEVEVTLSTIANNDEHLTLITGLLDGNTYYTDKDLAKNGAGTSWPNASFLLGLPQHLQGLSSHSGNETIYS